MPYFVRLVIYIAICVLLFFIFIFLFFYRYIKKFFIKKNVAKFYYHKVNKEAYLRDFYLVNDINYNLGGSEYVHIDHVLGGNKYIYVISDVYFDGAISAKKEDAYWVNYLNNGKKVNIRNPLFVSDIAVNRFSKASGINASFLIGIVLVNNDCLITPFNNERGESIFTPLSRLSKVIGTFEKDEIDPLVQEELEKVMINLHNEKEKEYERRKKRN